MTSPPDVRLDDFEVVREALIDLANTPSKYACREVALAALARLKKRLEVAQEAGKDLRRLLAQAVERAEAAEQRVKALEEALERIRKLAASLQNRHTGFVHISRLIDGAPKEPA